LGHFRGWRGHFVFWQVPPEKRRISADFLGLGAHGALPHPTCRVRILQGHLGHIRFPPSCLKERGGRGHVPPVTGAKRPA